MISRLIIVHMTRDNITMSSIQLQRFEVLSQLNEKIINGTEASEKLGLSARHIRRLKKRVKKNGAKGLIHRNKGKASTRKVDERIRAKILKILQTTYKHFGPTFASEKLAERDKILVSREWLRLFMTASKLWTPVKNG